jgi:hypothetical protein
VMARGGELDSDQTLKAVREVGGQHQDAAADPDGGVDRDGATVCCSASGWRCSGMAIDGAGWSASSGGGTEATAGRSHALDPWCPWPPRRLPGAWTTASSSGAPLVRKLAFQDPQCHSFW